MHKLTKYFGLRKKRVLFNGVYNSQTKHLHRNWSSFPYAIYETQ